MKKKIILLPLLAISLTACNFNFNSEDYSRVSSIIENTSIEPNDVAIRILNAFTVFPEMGDEVDFSEYVDFDAGYEHTLGEYTFTSSNTSVIQIDGYHGSCVGNGYATVAVSGPGINQQTEMSFFVGSIAGTYKPDKKALENLITFTVGEVNEMRECYFTLSVKQGTFRNRQVKAYEGEGTLIKSGSPFLQLDFAEGENSGFSPIVDYLALLGIDTGGVEIETNAYGLLFYDIEYGVAIKTIFMDELVEFYVA